MDGFVNRQTQDNCDAWEAPHTMQRTNPTFVIVNTFMPGRWLLNLLKVDLKLTQRDMVDGI